MKSQRGTQFRVWSNRILKDYLLRGYSINHRLAQLEQETIELSKIGREVLLLCERFKKECLAE